jgi:CRISPR-associated protein Cas1
MIKRTIEISSSGVFLSVELDQLVLRREGQELQRIPIEDVGVLIVDTNGATYTHAVITRLLGAGAVIVPCDGHHLPAGLLLPQDNCLQSQRLAAQVEASKPLRKQLWRQVVTAKIVNQADMLSHAPAAQSALRGMARRVRSGDPDNLEAQAARRYWPVMLGASFRRDHDGPPPNNLLNYGYTVLRAAVARAVAGAGLHPSLGLHHHNRSNAFCLADDLVEPLRPLVDSRVRKLHQAGLSQIDKETKRQLLGVLTETVTLGDNAGPLMVALERMAASLVRCYEGQSKRLDIPKPWNSADTASCGCS